MPAPSRPAEARSSGAGAAAPARLTRPELDQVALGDRWSLLGADETPGLPAHVSALVGRCGTVLVSQVAEAGPTRVEQGRLCCGPASLESAVSELGALAAGLAGRLEGRAPVPMVYAALLVPGARSSLFHRDVLVSPPGGLMRGIEAFPAVQVPAAVAMARAAVSHVASSPVAPDVVDGAGAPAAVPQPGPGGGHGAGLVQPRRRRTRRRAVLGGGTAVAFAVVAVVIAVTWYAVQKQTAPAAPLNPAAGTVPAATSTTTVGGFLPLLSYPGRQAGDVVAGTTGILQLDGARVSLAAPVVRPSLVGHMLLCVKVSVHNGRGGRALGDQAVNWAVRSPSGVVEHPSSLADNSLLARGQLVPGDAVQGRLCFNEPGQSGLYVLTYAPRGPHRVRSAPSPALRGVWLMNLGGV